ncbi:MAG: hypothetical protein MR394_01445 [Coprococcus comes]|nr:hypothetical protein [Coprococcus comes]
MNSRLTDEKKIAALDKKIELLQEKVVQKHREYDALTTELHELLNERYPERNAERVKDALYQAYQKSGKSIDECIELILNPDILDYL